MLEELVAMSNRYGRDPAYVLAGGGNTSEKIGDVIYVKGSGTSLATITEDDFVSLDRGSLTEMLDKPYPQEDAAREAAALADLMEARLPENGSKRPSVETLLHNLFPYKYVLHLHPALVNGLTCSQGAEKRAREVLGGNFVWVPIYRPGYALAVLCRDELERFRERTGHNCQMVLLQNHGIFLAADTTEEIDKMVDHVMSLLRKNAGHQPRHATRPYDPAYIESVAKKVASLYPEKVKTAFAVNADILDLLENDKTFAPLEDPFSPDHIVYCGAKFVYVHELEHLPQAYRHFVEKNGYEPRIICIRDVGVFCVGATQKTADNARALFLDAVDIAIYATNFGGWLHMTPDLIEFIRTWEVESYRSKVSGS